MTRALQFCGFGVSVGWQMHIEDFWGSVLADTVAIHLAAATPANRLLNTCDLSGYVSPRLDRGAPVRRNGCIPPPDGPGIGVEPDAATLGQPTAIID